MSAPQDRREPRVVTGGLDDPLLARVLPALDGAVMVDLALAFVFDAGVELLHDRLVDVLARPEARIRIVTGDYQDVTEPTALRHLLALPLIAGVRERGSVLEVRAFRVGQRAGESFHPKAWIVRGRGVETAWIGSSNLSRTALETGVEWNWEIVDAAEVAAVRRAFETLWCSPRCEVVNDDWIDAYERRRQAPVRGGRILPVAVAEDAPIEKPRPRPGIQTEALLRLQQTRLQDNRAGLVVLATGLGKTYVSAFDSQDFERVLFVAHREEILTQALATFRKVRPDGRLGLYYGKKKEERCDVLFASVQTLAERLEEFESDAFDYIVVDEFHHATAKTYRRVIDHFEPKFMLGLTATPDRLDGVNLLSLCEGNEVFRCDIPEGIRAGQLSPFRYYGIGDATEFEPIPWRSYTEEKLSALVETQARARHALETLRRYTTGRVKALGFCVTKRHAEFMAAFFRAEGVDCAAVYSGSAAPRTATLEDLATGKLEIVFCVDMFNEGVDVPAIDTVFMLRPTESSIVWLQQLGRGLRHVEGKTLTVLDYIGNHNVFLRRPEMLVELLKLEIDRRDDRWWEAARRADLPPGVAVEFDLEAQDILRSLREAAAKAGSKAVRWYREVRELRGERPTALEAERAGWLEQLSKKGGGWFGFVASEGDLGPEEQAVVQTHGGFFAELDGLPRESSHELSILLALLHLSPFPGRVRKRAITEWIATRARRSAALMRDLAVEGGDPRSIETLLTREAFPRLAKTGWFADGKQTFDSSALRTPFPAALAELTREFVDHRLTRYLESANKSATKLPPIRDDDGNPVDARFDVEPAPGGGSVVIVHSRGGKRGSPAERNTEYRKGLEILVRRMGRAGLEIERIEVDSADVRRASLSLAERTVELPYPLVVATAGDHAALARAIGNAAKKIGQKDGAKGGNDTRRLRITIRPSVESGELWALLFGPRAASR